VTSERQCDDVVPSFEASHPTGHRLYRGNYIKRFNHFKYWLQRLQGNETNRLTATDLHEIQQKLSEQPYEPITFTRMRFVLRKLKKHRFYNNTYFLLKHFTGTPLFQLDRHHEQALLDMFRKIQESFAESREYRINMLSYPYLIRKFAEILEWEDIVSQIPVLRSREKLREHDKIWINICHKMGFVFYPSL
jgi:hypothetical protein